MAVPELIHSAEVVNLLLNIACNWFHPAGIIKVCKNHTGLPVFLSRYFFIEKTKSPRKRPQLADMKVENDGFRSSELHNTKSEATKPSFPKATVV